METGCQNINYFASYNLVYRCCASGNGCEGGGPSTNCVKNTLMQRFYKLAGPENSSLLGYDDTASDPRRHQSSETPL